MQNNITKPKNFDLSKITFSNVKVNQHGGKSVYVNYNGGPLVMQLPVLSVPWGMHKDELKDSKTGDTIGHKYTISLSLRDADSSDDVKTVQSVVDNLDELMINAGKENGLTWLKQKNPSIDTVRALYTPTLKKSRDPDTNEPDGRFPDTIRGRVKHWQGKFTTEVYGTDKKIVDDPEEVLTKGSNLKSLWRCKGVWFISGKFGLSWEFVQILLTSTPQKITGFSFLSDSDDDGSDGESDKPTIASQDHTVHDDDEDDEDDELDGGVEVDDDDDDDFPPPKKVKVVRKKKT